jgi:hypothetical protein
VYVNTDEKVYHGLCTLMNEFGEVLQDLVTDMLGKKLQKPESKILSEDWTNVPLKEEQITSAALDAYAGIHVYWAIFLGQDPIFDDCSPTAIEPGSKANVYDSTGSNVIATGIVADQISGSCREYRQTVTNGREVVTIIDIVIPCALIPIALSKNGTNGPAQRWTIDEHERNYLLVNKKNVRPFKTATVLYAESLFPLASTTSSSSPLSLPPFRFFFVFFFFFFVVVVFFFIFFSVVDIFSTDHIFFSFLFILFYVVIVFVFCFLWRFS